MKIHNFFPILFLPLTFIFGSCGSTGSPTEYRNTDYEFKIDFPSYCSQVEKQTRPIESDAGPLEMVFFLAYSEHAVFMVGVLDHGFPRISETLTRESLRYARRQAARDAVILEENDFTLDGYPATSIRFRQKTGKGELFVHAFVTDIEGTQYQIQMAADSLDLLDSREAVRFFLSFSSLPEKKKEI